MKFRQSFLSFPFLYLSFIVYFSHKRERESCVYIFLISPFRPQYNSLMLLLFLSPPSLYNLHPPQSQYSVVYIVLNLNSGVITAWAVQLRCVCVGGVLAAAWWDSCQPMPLSPPLLQPPRPLLVMTASLLVIFVNALLMHKVKVFFYFRQIWCWYMIRIEQARPLQQKM